MLQHKATILCWTQLVNFSAAAQNRTELSYIVKSKSPSCIPKLAQIYTPSLDVMS